MSKKKCPICGAEMKIDTSAVCTSIPPKYRCVCPSCNCLDFIKTSEYDQYKEEPSLPSNLDEAAEEYGRKEYSHAIHFWDEGLSKNKPEVMKEDFVDAFKAGAEWMAGQGWIDDGSMPPETKQESDTLQGNREWTESEPVLAWDSMYGCLVDWTRNGKWMSEQIGGYTGQICHGIIAWRPIPEYKEKQ